MKNSSQNSLYPARDSNRTYPDYKLEALPIDPARPVDYRDLVHPLAQVRRKQ
jgi:hypothetical protein